MVWFWQKMTEMYGALWTSVFGVVPIKLWVNALAKIDGPSLKIGLVKCLGRKDRFGMPDKFPPNLPEFIALCRQAVIPLCHRRYKALPKPAMDKALVMDNLGKIREVLGRG